MQQGERTEKATPKRREDARRKGQFARSTELPAVAGLCAALVMLQAVGPQLMERAGGLFVRLPAAVRAGSGFGFGAEAAERLLLDASLDLLLLTLPAVAAAAVAAAAASVAQTGFRLTPELLKPRAERFSPLANFKRAYGAQAPVELAKNLLKLCAVGVAGYGAARRAAEEAPRLVGAPAAETLAALGSIAGSLVWRAALCLLVVAALDYAWQFFRHERQLRMSKQEVKDEYRQQEGDPLVKGQRRRAARSLVRQRLAVEVPRADVVVTNPTHFAVALRYDRGRDAAPVVVAKGADHLAARIRRLAREHKVEVVENPPLARALYRDVHIGRAVPPELFRAVAELLAYVYRLREKK
jgi:flagellar biosynthesis protein FlhB